MAEFDSIADEYDSTRRPATQAEINALSRELHGGHTILDVGVGTGRFAKPLSELGFEVVGVDLSRGMMSRARQKGLSNLVLADAHKMPFRDGAFDASILIHVLHLITDWVNLVGEIGRVTKERVISLLSNRWTNRTDNRTLDDRWSSSLFGLWQLYSHLREEAGYPLKAQWSRRMWYNEEEIKQKIPPSRLQEISDELVTVTPHDILTRFEERMTRSSFRSRAGSADDVPEDVHKKIISKMKSLLEDGRQKSVIERRVIEEIAVWKPEQLRLGVRLDRKTFLNNGCLLPLLGQRLPKKKSVHTRDSGKPCESF
ncbi:MAG: methyltransferase domain-containing protein [Nitrososphaerota archaeon]|nr:methyltransferase domain-containing protein [Nitrososphaerota archaeon]